MLLLCYYGLYLVTLYIPYYFIYSVVELLLKYLIKQVIQIEFSLIWDPVQVKHAFVCVCMCTHARVYGEQCFDGLEKEVLALDEFTSSIG